MEELPAGFLERMERELALGKIPGLACGVVRESGLTWHGGAGVADTASGRRPDLNTLFRIASITKTVTATAILQLRDQGLLCLDDPLSKHLPEFAGVQGVSDAATVRRVLTHFSGLAGETPVLDWERLNFPTREAMLDALSQTRMAIPHDTALKYSNLGYSLLGEVVARKTGVSFEEAITQRILKPLGMNATVFEPAMNAGETATGYLADWRLGEAAKAPVPGLRGMSPCGGLWSNVADVAKWVAAQFPGHPTCLLSERSLEEAHCAYRMEPDWSVGYGLGFRGFRSEGEVFWGHGGGLHGFTSMALYSIPRRVGVVCLGNRWPHPGVFGLARDLLGCLIEHELKPPASVPAQACTLEDDADAPAWVGEYSAWPDIWLRVTCRAGRVRLERSRSEYLLHVPAELEAVRGDSWVVRTGRAAGERVEFHRRQGGGWEFSLGGWRYRKT